MEELSSSFFMLPFTLNGMGLFDRLSKMKRLLREYIAGALRTWLCLRFFEGSPAVSRLPKILKVGKIAHFFMSFARQEVETLDR